MLLLSSKPWSKILTARILPISSDSTDKTAPIPVVLPIEETNGILDKLIPGFIISTELIPPCILVESEL